MSASRTAAWGCYRGGKCPIPGQKEHIYHVSNIQEVSAVYVRGHYGYKPSWNPKPSLIK